MNKQLSQGVVHTVPDDLRKVITTTPQIYTIWEDITPLARNEWICWIQSAKKAETRKHRIDVMVSKMKQGDRRPCCWEGCSHRKKK
ncbi:MAG: YdeI/OmpD-associated family protein [Patescibacteria group bacterium]